jgi:hypothetical protein
MPTVLRAGPYRFLFYSSDAEEPPHVHVERDDNTASSGWAPFASRAAVDSSLLRFGGFNGWLSNTEKRC